MLRTRPDPSHRGGARAPRSAVAPAARGWTAMQSRGLEMQGTLIQKIIKTARHPKMAASAIRRAAFAREEYVCTKANRSLSDNGYYIVVVQAAVRNYKAFSTFKRH